MANPKTQATTIQRLSQPLRSASLWLALAVALLSSVLSSGLPRTTALGSAFNPATTAVALQPSRAQPRVMVGTIRRDDDPDGQGRAVEAALRSIAPAASVPVVRVAPGQSTPALPPASHDVLDGSPRGPPLT